MTTRSCSTWLNSTLARSASGAVSFVGCGNTAVPGTRGIASLSSCSTNSGNGPSTSTRRAVMIFLPRCQVVMMVTTIAATSSGSHPPWTILMRFAPR